MAVHERGRSTYAAADGGATYRRVGALTHALGELRRRSLALRLDGDLVTRRRRIQRRDVTRRDDVKVDVHAASAARRRLCKVRYVTGHMIKRVNTLHSTDTRRTHSQRWLQNRA